MFSILSALVTGAALPKHWGPTDPVPPGISSSITTLKAPISSSAHLHFITTGVWNTGTLTFSVRDNQEPPSYNLAVTEAVHVGTEKGRPQLAEGESFLEVTVEARYSDQKLWEECKVVLGVTGDGRVELKLETPVFAAHRVLSQLAFHIAFFFPPSLEHLASLTTTSGQWRTLGDVSFAGLYIHRLDITTNNAGLRFDDLRAKEVSLHTTNGSIEGTYDVKSLEIATTNGSVSGTYKVLKTARARTTNDSISGSFHANILNLSTSNGTIGGNHFGRWDLWATASNGGITGDFEGSHVKITTSNAMIQARINAEETRLQTSNAPINVKIHELTCIPEDTKEVRPRWDRLELVATTSNAPISVVVEARSVETGMQVELTTSNGEISLRDPTTFCGSYEVTTSNAVASFKTSKGDRSRKTEEGPTKKEGMVQVNGMTQGHIMVSTSNADATVVFGRVK